MKNILLVIVAFLLVSSSAFAYTNIVNTAATGDSQPWGTTAGYEFIAQTFYVNTSFSNMNITVIELGVNIPATGGTCWFDLRQSNTSDNYGTPIGSTIANSTTFPCSTAAWYNATLSPNNVLNNTNYSIVLRQTGITGSPRVIISPNAANVYKTGAAARSTTDATWLVMFPAAGQLNDILLRVSAEAQLPGQNLTFISQSYNGLRLLNFNATVSNETQVIKSTTNGQIVFGINSSTYSATVYQIQQNTLISKLYSSISGASSNVFDYSILNISARSNLSGVPLTTFTTTVYNLNTGVTLTNQTTSSTSLFYVENGNYSITVDALGFSLGVLNTTTINGVNDVNFNIQATNSVTLYIFNQSSGFLMNTTPFTATLYSSNNSIAYQRSVSGVNTLLIANLTPDLYQVDVDATGFFRTTRFITVTNRSAQNLNIYLAPTTANSVIMQTLDDGLLTPISNVTAVVSSYVGNLIQIINSFRTDEAGQFQFNYVQNQYYTISLSKEGYSNKVVLFTPILQSSYSIYMIPLSNNSQYSGALSGISVTVRPSILIDNRTNSINVTIGSPDGRLQSYNVSVTGSFGSFNDSGTNAFGGILTTNIPVFNSTILSKVYVTYAYELSDGSQFSFTEILVVDLASFNSQSGQNLADNFGFSIFDRIVIMVFLTIIATGLGRLFGGFAGATIVALFCFCFFIYVGFISWYLAAIPIIFLFFIISGGQR